MSVFQEELAGAPTEIMCFFDAYFGVAFCLEEKHRPADSKDLVLPDLVMKDMMFDIHDVYDDYNDFPPNWRQVDKYDFHINWRQVSPTWWMWAPVGGNAANCSRHSLKVANDHTPGRLLLHGGTVRGCLISLVYKEETFDGYSDDLVIASTHAVLPRGRFGNLVWPASTEPLEASLVLNASPYLHINRFLCEAIQQGALGRVREDGHCVLHVGCLDIDETCAAHMAPARSRVVLEPESVIQVKSTTGTGLPPVYTTIAFRQDPLDLIPVPKGAFAKHEVSGLECQIHCSRVRESRTHVLPDNSVVLVARLENDLQLLHAKFTSCTATNVAATVQVLDAALPCVVMGIPHHLLKPEWGFEVINVRQCVCSRGVRVQQHGDMNCIYDVIL